MSELAVIRQKMEKDFHLFAYHFLKIQTKDLGIAPFYLNPVQLRVHHFLQKELKEKGKIRAIILKARQQGCSTYIAGRFYWKTTHQVGKKSFILSHSADSTNTLFTMIKRFHDSMPVQFKVSVDLKNAKQLRFDQLDSSFGVGTAGSAHTGRGEVIHNLHCSEVAYWPNAAELVSGLLQCVPNAEGSECIFESTSSGQGNFFHNLCLKAIAKEIDYEFIFIPWHWSPEYKAELPKDFVKTDEELELSRLYELSDEQLQWRRQKIAEFELTGSDGQTLFRREYPIHVEEAFQAADTCAFIKSDLVQRARKHTCEGSGPLIIGVDPATEDGKDSTAIVFRRGLRAFNLIRFKSNLMDLTGRLVDLIRKEKPEVVAIDVIGIGRGVVDRLNELGFKSTVRPVNAASKSFFQDRYFNKRHEMYGELKAWLADENAQASIPDDEALAMDLSCLDHSYDSSGRVRLPSKDELRKKLKRSPDTADALALTFAFPVNEKATVNARAFFNPTMRL